MATVLQMPALSELSERERFLLTTPDDSEEAPWMVMASLQVRDIDLLKAILGLHARRRRLRWFLESYHKVVGRRPISGEPLEAAPDLLVAHADDRLRTSWRIVTEGKAPEFALEVVSTSSQGRDTSEKPTIYEELGVLEYAIFAPERKDGGSALSGYRRDERGNWVDWPADERGVLWSRELAGLGLYVEDQLWLRAVDTQGQRLPTPEEAWAQESRLREAEAARRTSLEAEVARLQEELRRLREGQA